MRLRLLIGPGPPRNALALDVLKAKARRRVALAGIRLVLEKKYGEVLRHRMAKGRLGMAAAPRARATCGAPREMRDGRKREKKEKSWQKRKRETLAKRTRTLQTGTQRRTTRRQPIQHQ